jgi:hypothetical protein
VLEKLQLFILSPNQAAENFTKLPNPISNQPPTASFRNRSFQSHLDLPIRD